MTYNANHTKSAVGALNSYVWKLLEANFGWQLSSYNGMRPIIPNSQQPELMTSGNPFLVYGSAVQPPNFLYQIRTESIAYSIFSTDPDEVNNIANLLTDCFERQDLAAADVNAWLGVENKSRGISFTSIKLSMVERAEPANQEGGFVQGIVLIEMKYTAQLPTAQFTGFTP